MVRSLGLVLALALAVAVVACTTKTKDPAEPSDVRTYAALDSAQRSTASCTETVRCYEQCPESEHGCTAGCDWRASQPAYFASRSLFDCLVENGCRTHECGKNWCGDQLQICGFGIEIDRSPLVSNGTKQ